MSIFVKNDSSLAVLCDIGSGSITASLVSYSKSSLPTFLYTIVRSFAVADKPDSFKLVDNMVTSLDEIILKVIDEGLSDKQNSKKSKEIQNVVVSFSSPWFIQKTKQIEVKEYSQFVVTENYLKELTKHEEGLFIQEIKESHEDSTEDFDVIESSIVHIKVNGYIISKIIGQKVTSLNAYLCMSLISKNVLDKVLTVVQKHTHLDKEKVILHTFPIVSFTVLRDVFSGFQDFILMDVTSEVTDITLVSNDVLVKTTSIPLGRNYLIRQIAKQFSVPSEIAESELSLFASAKLVQETGDRIKDILIDIEKEWAIYLERALVELSPTLNLPVRVYLTSEHDVASIYTDYIKLSKADATANFRKTANIIKIDQKTLESLIKNDTHTMPNEYIQLLSIFWNKFVFK